MSKFKFSITSLLRGFLLSVIALVIAACDVPVQTAETPSVDPTKPVIVAMMVPYGSSSSANDRLADDLVNSARMAQNDLNGVTIDLRIYHTGANPEKATAEATRAIAEGAQIIIGPLYSNATSAVASVAAANNIKVLSFSNNAVVAGGNVYIMGVTFEDIATRLYGHAAGKGLTNVGVVYPEGVEGEAGRTAASNAANYVGANLASAVSYPLNVAGLSDAAPNVASSLKSNGVQAVLFTDTPTRGLPFITAALATNGVRASTTLFMGLSRWDSSQELLKQPSVQGGIFAVPDPSLTSQFKQRYLAAHGSEPNNIAAIAYDAVAAIGALAKSAQSEGAPDMFAAERIINPGGFVGVSGIFRFRASGLNQRGLAILKVDNGDAVIIEPAPRNFGGLGF